MKTHLTVRVQKPRKEGFIGVRVEERLSAFFTISAVALECDASDMLRAALKEKRDALLRGKQGRLIKQEIHRRGLARELL